MTVSTEVVDWATVRLTAAAQNTKTPASRVNVICVPRAVSERTWAGAEWQDFCALEAACARGEDGLTPLIVLTPDMPERDVKFIRCGDSSDGKLRGRSLLFRQGWTA